MKKIEFQIVKTWKFPASNFTPNTLHSTAALPLPRRDVLMDSTQMIRCECTGAEDGSEWQQWDNVEMHHEGSGEQSETGVSTYFMPLFNCFFLCAAICNCGVWRCTPGWAASCTQTKLWEIYLTLLLIPYCLCVIQRWGSAWPCYLMFTRILIILIQITPHFLFSLEMLRSIGHRSWSADIG